MSAPQPLEQELLRASEDALRKASASLGGDAIESRLQVLEGCAARLGGFDLSDFHRCFGIRNAAAPSLLIELAAPVVWHLQRSGVHPSLGLSALAREVLSESVRKTTGAYHTDFRLAAKLAESAASGLADAARVMDPACGTGILLVALTLKVCGLDRAKLATWLQHSVFAADLSSTSLRGAILALASFTDDVSTLEALSDHFVCGDSLLRSPVEWKRLSEEGFDLVIGNPPWEKVKLTRHEFLKSNGSVRHYGAETLNLPAELFGNRRNEVADYAAQLLKRFPALGCGEPDLYVAFIELFQQLCRPGGKLVFLAPGGLIRSQGTTSVRHDLLRCSTSLAISILDNKARFFEIDTRFKFLLVESEKACSSTEKRRPLTMTHLHGSAGAVTAGDSVIIGRAALLAARPDASIPEVRNAAEWRVFQSMTEAGCTWNDPAWGWNAHIVREIDMTKSRPHFLLKKAHEALPVIEGRMVQPHRFGAKAFVSGSGRQAVWRSMLPGETPLQPQFWIARKDIPQSSLERTQIQRAGFCDITGQTNERSLMASLIPPGVVCGNKVPTVTFPDDPDEDRLLVWTAIVNSIPFDWMLRRVITTTVNYFLLQSIALPKLAKGGLPWNRIVDASRQLTALDRAHVTPLTASRCAEARRVIDAEVAVAYGLSVEDLAVMFHDFPLLDRGQPALQGEARSTVTRDSLLAFMAKRRRVSAPLWNKRQASAEALGATAYILGERTNQETGLQTLLWGGGHG